ncbi:MAG TPA: tRNA lysidine(34) synthetase TilS [Pyrinomonadaceae bacterium]|nr:tRNA lysidine(34) synthetase TilS [Pyrinomonadaceae bacterium]
MTAPATKRLERRRIGTFAARLWSEWRRLKLPVDGDDIVIAVSGGADSTALLLAMHELTSAQKLTTNLLVAHLDHRLRQTGRRDAQAVSTLAGKLGIRVVIGRADVNKVAREAADNLEQAARRARYAFLERTAKRTKAKLILVGHTMDDQAETVLLRLLRGSAAEGLSGMEAVRPLHPGAKIQLVRPLLSWATRTDTETYCRLQNVEFAMDEMNQDERFARVRVRRQLLPLMKSFNNKIVETLFRTATLLREDSASLASEAAQLLMLATDEPRQKEETGYPALNVDMLARAPAALRRRALRQWLLAGRGDLRRIEHVHLLGVERLLEGQKGGRVAELPNGMKVRRRQGRLELIGKKS